MSVVMDRLPTPSEIIRQLDRLIRGQHRAKRDLPCRACRHFLAAAHRERQPEIRHPFGKRHVLHVGPTCAGKTHLVRSLTAILGVPLAFAGATTLVEAGNAGERIDTVFRRVYLEANRDAAARGIICVDEIDKVRRQDVGGRHDVYGEGAQTSLLTPLDGCPVEVRAEDVRVTLDDSNVLFICTGAFGGLADTVCRRLGAGRTLGFNAAGCILIEPHEGPDSAPMIRTPSPARRLSRSAKTGIGGAARLRPPSCNNKTAPTFYVQSPRCCADHARSPRVPRIGRRRTKGEWP